MIVMKNTHEAVQGLFVLFCFFSRSDLFHSMFVQVSADKIMKKETSWRHLLAWTLNYTTSYEKSQSAYCKGEQFVCVSKE